MNIKTLMTFGLALVTAASAAKYEAESATIGGDATARGTYVDLNQGSITFSNVSVDAAGKYTLIVHCAGSYGAKDNNIEVNGASAGTFHVNEGNDYVDISTSVTLNAGANTVAITASWGWIKVDYIEITPYESAPFSISSTLVTENATAEAVKLYNFLVNNFGTKTISGVMTGNMDHFTINSGNGIKNHEDVASVYTRSGKYPVLVGFDFIFVTGPDGNTDWRKTYTDKAIFLAKDLWNQGGIPAFTWHWKDPLDQDDGFYASQEKGNPWTSFRVSQAFVSGTTNWDENSAAYKGIIADIDVVADYFLELQNANVAAIFRPLHEAGGDWFWWSSNTSGAQFAALYRLIYDRMVKVKGVKNLVWVFNPEASLDNSWDPGADYYDVIAVDVYNSANDHSSISFAFDGFKKTWGTSKIYALSENGPIPDVDNMHMDQAVWSWWMPWYGSWGEKNYIAQTSNDVWKKNMEDERIITLDEMPGWANAIELSSNSNIAGSSSSKNTMFSSSSSPISSASNITTSSSSNSTNAGSSTSTNVNPTSSNANSNSNSNNNPTNTNDGSSNTEAIGTTLPHGTSLTLQGNSLSFTTARSVNASLDVFDLQGNRVANLHKGTLSAGTHQFSLSGMARGSYLVRAKGAGLSATKRIVIK